MRVTTDNDNAVIAEGIETEEQYQQLKVLGCEYGQGFWFSRPVDNYGVQHLRFTP